MPIKDKKVVKKINYYPALGRRKSATCRVRLYLTNKDKSLKKVKETLKLGDFLVNWVKADVYFPSDSEKRAYLKPLKLTDSLKRFIVVATVKGSGKVSQLEAMTLGMARALEKVNPEYRPILKSEGLLTVDARVRERRKAGMAGKARKKRQSPKR